MVTNAGGFGAPTVSRLNWAGWQELGCKMHAGGVTVVFYKSEKNTVFWPKYGLFGTLALFFWWCQHDVIRWGQGRMTLAWRHRVTWRLKIGPRGWWGGGQVRALADGVLTQWWRSSDAGSQVLRNRKWLAVWYRTASHTEAGLSEWALIQFGGDAWRRPDVTLWQISEGIFQMSGPFRYVCGPLDEKGAIRRSTDH